MRLNHSPCHAPPVLLVLLWLGGGVLALDVTACDSGGSANSGAVCERNEDCALLEVCDVGHCRPYAESTDGDTAGDADQDTQERLPESSEDTGAEEESFSGESDSAQEATEDATDEEGLSEQAFEVEEETTSDYLDATEEAGFETESFVEDETSGEEEPWRQPPLWDIDAIRDPSTAQCSFAEIGTTIKNGVLVTQLTVSYYSWESIDGELRPILIRGFAAYPTLSSGALPGIVQAHGLGGYAEASHANGVASLVGAFAIAFTGPGGGTDAANISEGRPAFYDDARRLFDTIPDLRGAWFWGHAMAALRAVTCLTQHAKVDASRIGVTGYSAGAVISLMTVGVDDRIKASVPLSGSGAWDIATRSPNAWQHALLKKAGYTIDSPQWLRLMQHFITPEVMAGSAAGAVMMVNGTTDEFFPVTAHMATYLSLDAASRRTAFVANLDHGCYALTGVENQKQIEERAQEHADGAQRMWFRHHFDLDNAYKNLPEEPQIISVTAVGAVSQIVAAVDTGGTQLVIDSVKLYFSQDRGLLWAHVDLDTPSRKKGVGFINQLAAMTLGAETLYYLDVVYKTKNKVIPEYFAISSRVAIPDGLVPQIRAMDTCLTR